MKKFIEFGLGNRWLVRTEFEKDDGTEWEVKGISGKVKPLSIYLRCWLGQTVWIADSRQGFKRQKKSKKRLKLVFGIVSDV